MHDQLRKAFRGKIKHFSRITFRAALILLIQQISRHFGYDGIVKHTTRAVGESSRRSGISE